MIRAYFHPPANVRLPDWAGNLNNYYWMIRVEGRDKAKRLRYYRLIRKEKLRLVESGLIYEVVDAACKYLISFNAVKSLRFQQLLQQEPLQKSFQFEF